MFDLPKNSSFFKKTASSTPTKPTLWRLFTYTDNFTTLQDPKSYVIYQDLGFKDMVTIQDPSSEVALPVLKNRF